MLNTAQLLVSLVSFAFHGIALHEEFSKILLLIQFNKYLNTNLCQAQKCGDASVYKIQTMTIPSKSSWSSEENIEEKTTKIVR